MRSLRYLQDCTRGCAVGLALLLSAAALDGAPAFAQSSQPLTLRVGVYDNSPKVSPGAGDRPEGIFIDVIEEIARREGWRLQYVPGSWRDGLDRLAAGEIDLMPDVALTSERQQLYAFHQEPVLSSWNEVYARRGGSIQSLLDLKGKRVAVLDGSMQQDYLRNLAAGFDVEFEIRSYADFGRAFEAVRVGAADAVVTNRFFGLRHAASYELEATAIMFNPSRLYFAAPLAGNAAVLTAIDGHLRDLKRTPSSPYYATLSRWGIDATSAPVQAWVKWAAAAALLLALASIGWTLVARRHAARIEQSEAAQRQLAEELSLILDHSLDAICVFDADLRFLRASAACQKLWGYTPEALIGRSYLDLVPPADRAQTLEVVAQMRDADRSSTLGVVESRTLAANGSRVPVVWSAAWSPVQRRWYAVARDDSERRRLLHESESRARELERAAAELAVARDAAEAADRTKSAFLATMSHELRTPLNSIIGFTGIVLQELAGPLNAEQKKQLGMVRDSSRHLLALINDVLDISKIEAGEVRVVPAPFDLRASIAKVAGLVEPMARKKGLDLRVTLDPALDHLMADARRMEQVLLNLLSNAIKFTETGSVSLDVRKDAAGEVHFRVTDTGMGIRSEDMNLLFKPFRQIDSALSRSHEGTGLGLAICSRLASLMGGRIEAHSTWQHGSSFTLMLPLTVPEPAEATA